MCKKNEIKTSIKKFNSCKMEKLGELFHFTMRSSNVFFFAVLFFLFIIDRILDSLVIFFFICNINSNFVLDLLWIHTIFSLLLLSWCCKKWIWWMNILQSLFLFFKLIENTGKDSLESRQYLILYCFFVFKRIFFLI